jgi:zinc-ribbon domain
MSDTVISNVELCPKCRYANPAGSKFCMQCGAKFSATEQGSKKYKLTVSNSSDKGKKSEEYTLSGSASIGKKGDIPLKLKSGGDIVCEIKIEGDKVYIQSTQSGDVYIKIQKDKPVELPIGSEFTIEDYNFKLE